MSNNFQADPKRREKSNNFKPLKRLVPYFLKYRWEVACALIALSVSSMATLVVPVAVRRLMDSGFSASDVALVDRYFLLMSLVVLLLATGSAFRFFYVNWIGERVVADVRDAVFKHLMVLTPGFYSEQRTGEMMSRLTVDTTLIKSAFSTTASNALRNGFMFIGSVLMMVVTSPRLSGFAVLAIPVFVIPLVVYGNRVRLLSRDAQDTLAESAAFAQERMSAISTVQANGQEDRTTLEFSDATTTAFRAATLRIRGRAFMAFAVISVSMGAIVVLLWLGARDVILGAMTAGTLSQFVLYALIAASALGQLSEFYGEIQSAAGAAGRLSELLDEVPYILSPAVPVPLPTPVRGRVQFSNVNFRYSARPDAAVLCDISFEAHPGEVVAIVGPSGGGKTTLFNLLQRFHDPQSGSISVDGLSIASVSLEALRKSIAAVPQDPVIFSGPISDNIRFSRPDATEADMLAAARSAHVHDFVRDLPDGYGTLLGERGVTLSGGQRQRISIARALLRNAPILLLDEATSALDAESEALVQKALEELTVGRTTLVIAHRLATVRNADRIIVLDKGRLLAQGTHAQLLKSSPLYARLADLQFNVPLA
jgi:ATP-binding cassette, subfamily B, bacterial